MFGSQPCLAILSLSILVAALIFLLVCVSIVQEGKVRKIIHTLKVKPKKLTFHIYSLISWLENIRY